MMKPLTQKNQEGVYTGSTHWTSEFNSSGTILFMGSFMLSPALSTPVARSYKNLGLDFSGKYTNTLSVKCSVAESSTKNYESP